MVHYYKISMSSFGTGSNSFSGLIKKKNKGGGGKAKKNKNENAQNKNNNDEKKNPTEDAEKNNKNQVVENNSSSYDNLSDLKKALFKEKDDEPQKNTNDSNAEAQQNENENENENETENKIDKFGKSSYLNSPWTVWVHRNDCDDWTVDSYKNIHLIDSIGAFWDFFNNFHKVNKEENQYFIMRNKIKPIWEDNNNRSGGICSFKMDCYDRNGRKDIGSEILICFCILIMNESFMQDNNEINGISYSVKNNYSIKNRSIYIKIWTRDFSNNIVDKLPKNLITKFNNVIRNNMHKKFDNYISIRYKPIKPEDEEGEKN
jgi:Eukaryotic initiation factor 4E